MKTPLVLTAVILIAGSLVGWRQTVVVRDVQNELMEVEARASELGFALEEGADGVVVSYKASDRDRRDKEEEARAFAVRLIAFSKEMKEHEKSGSQNTPEVEKRVFEMVGGLLELDVDQLRFLVDELRTTSELDDSTRREMSTFVVMMLAQDHPETALSLLTESSDMVNLGPIAIVRWAAQDPFAAMEWMRKESKDHPEWVTEETQQAVLASVAQKNPSLAFEWAAELKLENDYWLSRSDLTDASRSEVLAALRKQSDSEVRNGALAGMAGKLAEAGYDRARRWLDTAELSESELKSWSNGLNYRQTGKDTGNWLEWMEEQSVRGEAAEQKAAELMKHWTDSDYRAAGEWLAAAEPGATQKASVLGYVAAVAPYDPVAAAQWLETLPQGEDRSALAQRVFREWSNQDEAAARAFAEKEGLEEKP
ncbi:hypothetical protein HNR46_001147 [Haloferula luteola]|uniref:Uncharacterized protein n=1 Tax=Haloferula luteola TaxID=595692 RepID=A0A840V0Q6_9BACT|nr:hypothetical protein [Haloferula luteola]MBB5350913.1 hypothetical protein [Haloferula luteola]